MKTLGIIGGFSPEATAKFYLELIRLCRLQGMEAQPHVIVWNVPVPRSFETNLLLHGKGARVILKDVIRAAQELEKAGADMIVLPCNTLHVLAQNIQESIQVPFISIVDVVSEHIREEKIKNLGILGSSLTVSSDFFRKIVPVNLPPQMQRKLNNSLLAVVEGNGSEGLRQTLGACIKNLRNRKVHDVLVACTDFSGLCPRVEGIRLHDTLSLLVQKTTRQILSP